MPGDGGPVMIWAVRSARWRRRDAYCWNFDRIMAAAAKTRVRIPPGSRRRPPWWRGSTWLLFVPKRVVRLCVSYTYVAMAGLIGSSRQMWCPDPAGVHVHISEAGG